MNAGPLATLPGHVRRDQQAVMLPTGKPLFWVQLSDEAKDERRLRRRR